MVEEYIQKHGVRSLVDQSREYVPKSATHVKRKDQYSEALARRRRLRERLLGLDSKDTRARRCAGKGFARDREYVSWPEARTPEPHRISSPLLSDSSEGDSDETTRSRSSSSCDRIGRRPAAAQTHCEHSDRAAARRPVIPHLNCASLRDLTRREETVM